MSKKQNKPSSRKDIQDKNAISTDMVSNSPNPLPKEIQDAIAGFPAEDQGKIQSLIMSSSTRRSFASPVDSETAMAQINAGVTVSEHGKEVALAEIGSRDKDNAHKHDLQQENQRSTSKKTWFYSIAGIVLVFIIVFFSLYLIYTGQTELGLKILTYAGTFLAGGVGGYGGGKIYWKIH